MSHIILPNPKFVQKEEDGPIRETDAVVISKAPPYGQRAGWIPKDRDSFGDGGSYPEINIAQYPLDMGLVSKASSGGALALQVDSQGLIKYDAIARQGHDKDKIIHSSFKDLIPLRHRVDSGEINLERPDEELVTSTAERTNAALQALVSGQLAASRPKTIKTQRKGEPTYVRYTPSNQMGEASDVAHRQRIIKMVEMPEDPMEPPKHRHRKVPRGPGSPPPPIMHSPPRKITAKEQADWVIPPSISNWKNAKGYTIPLDKRLAADGRGLQDVSINDNFAKLSEALYMADRHAREEVKSRSLMQQKIAQKDKEKKEEHLRQLAQKARAPVQDERDERVESESDEEDEGVRERERLRRERRQDAERALRLSRMSKESQMAHLARESNRDISEKIALGLAKPTMTKESLFDSRLFNQSAGLDSGFGADDSYNLYDKPLFANRDAVNAIYRPGREDESETVENVTKGGRFEVLGQAQKGFKGAEGVEARDGPVQFEKDNGDPFAITEFLNQVSAENLGGKRKRE